MEKIIDDIAKNIKKYRKLNRMTQKDLALQVGVSIAAVSNWETGSNSIDIDVLFKVCDALNVPISVMTSSCDTDLDLTPIERELIEYYRKANFIDQLMILRFLGVPETDYPAHILRYYELFKNDTDNREI